MTGPAAEVFTGRIRIGRRLACSRESSPRWSRRFATARSTSAALRELVELQIAAGVDGVVPCGSTGEAATLSHAEHRRVVEIVVEAARGRVA